MSSRSIEKLELSPEAEDIIAEKLARLFLEQIKRKRKHETTIIKEIESEYLNKNL